MSSWLPLTPLFSTLGFALTFAVLMAIGQRVDSLMLNVFVAVLLVLLTLVLLSTVYVLYKWLWRRNEHFKR